MKSTKLKLVSAFFLIVILAVSLSACGGSAPEAAPAASNDAAAAPADAAAPAAPASGDIVAAFKFTNSGAVDICELYLSPVEKNEWGPNQLPSGQTIAAGGVFTLTNIPAAKYDAKWVGCDKTEGTIQVDIKN
jgi:hypothetical protein